MMRRLLLLSLLLLAGGCTVVDQKYPLTWDPLPVPATSDCLNFEGSYADRGEMAGMQNQPSLTLGLFGRHSNWENAERVRFAFPAEDQLLVRVQGKDKPLFERTLRRDAGDFRCERGRLIIRNKRWVAADMFSGREDVVIELDALPKYLVAQVREAGYGVMFAIVPVSPTATNWYRFPRK